MTVKNKKIMTINSEQPFETNMPSYIKVIHGIFASILRKCKYRQTYFTT